MTDYQAIGLAEGFVEPTGTEVEQGEQIVNAWQHLVNTGLAWSLQGWFGRTAKAMLDAGVIKPVPNRGNDE